MDRKVAKQEEIDEFGDENDDFIDEGRPGEAESEKRKRRQDRHRLLERRRRERTQQLLIDIQAELEKSQEGVQNVAIASFTLNKALQHVVQHVKEASDKMDVARALSRGKLAVGGAPPPQASESPEDDACLPEDQDSELVRLSILASTTPVVFVCIDGTELASTTPVAFVCMDGTLLECNASFSQMLGYAPGEVEGQSFYLHAAPVDMAQLMTAVCELMQRPERTANPVVRLMTKSGSIVPTQLDIAACKVAPGKVFMMEYVTRLSQHQVVTVFMMVYVTRLSQHQVASQQPGPPAFPLQAPQAFALNGIGSQPWSSGATTQACLSLAPQPFQHNGIGSSLEDSPLGSFDTDPRAAFFGDIRLSGNGGGGAGGNRSSITTSTRCTEAAEEEEEEEGEEGEEGGG
ncbi:hypothetical protein T484DRAFT_1810882 [Baffinella frigidus]|nr:hypothetical protein T484DRAFT_1810882 [Cryptophyta sp. CCMP2293]